MERPVFSISTSFYNRGKWVDHAYECVKNQTYPFWEWVVTDDFSTEDSAEERLKEIAAQDPRVKYYTQSRKKEVFYNPNYGCSGNVIVMFDSDDIIYPKLLEVYAKYFSEDPELMGVCTGGISYEGLVGQFNSITALELDKKSNFNFAQWARAWRNVIPHFDFNGELKYYQNDTNIWRQVEARGKVMFIQRELYNYNFSENDSVSRVLVSPEIAKGIEDERLWIEGKFPKLVEEDKCTFDLKFLPIEKLSWAFYGCDFNKAKDPKSLLFIKTDLKPYEKQLLGELFWDQSIDYNISKREKYDEVIIYLNEETHEYLEKNLSFIREKHPDIPFRFFYDTKEFNPSYEELENLLQRWGWKQFRGMVWGNI
jgi:glycosyltransferase involved in cell wall biosynthesis